ncbi:hypothetical protein LER59_00005, partial [Pseudomonas aeruginosa]
SLASPADFESIKSQQGRCQRFYTVWATDEQGDPLYEDVGPTPRFLSLSRKYLHELVAQQDTSSH